MKKDGFIRGFIHVISANALGRIVALATLPILLRLYTPDDYAKYGLFLTVVQAGLLLTGWLSNALVRFGREELLQDGTCNRTFWSIILLRAPLAVIACVATFVLAPHIESFTQLPGTVTYMVCAAMVLGLFSGLGDLLQAEERFAASAWVSQIPSLTLLASAILIVTRAVPAQVMVLVVANVAGGALASGLFFKLIARNVRHPVVDRAWMGGILLFSWPFFLHWISVNTIDYVDTVVIRKYLPLASVGIYTIAYSFYRFIKMPLQSVSVMLLPTLTSYYVAGRHDRLGWLYARIMPQLVFLTVHAACLGIVALPLLELFVGHRFASAAHPLAVLLASCGISIVTLLITPALYATKRTVTHVVAYASMASVNVALDVVLVPRVGILGAATATGCAELAGCLIQGLWCAKRYGANLTGCLLQNLPLVPVLIVYLLHVPWPVIGLVWLVSLAIHVAFARRVALFDGDSMRFYEAVTEAHPRLKPIIRFFESCLVVA